MHKTEAGCALMCYPLTNTILRESETHLPRFVRGVRDGNNHSSLKGGIGTSDRKNSKSRAGLLHTRRNTQDRRDVISGPG